jgi:hypothetical protein
MNRLILSVTVILLVLVAAAGCAASGPPATATPRLLPTSVATDTPYVVAQSTTTRAAATSTAGPDTVTPAASRTGTETARAKATVVGEPRGTATVVSPTPIPLPDGTLERYSNVGPYLLAPPEGGQPTHNLLVDGQMRGYLAINPAHWGDSDALPDMEGYGRNYMAEEEELSFLRRREQGARGYYDRFRPTYEQMRGKIHAWMSTWAFVYGDEDFADDWVAFQTEWLRLMHADGYLAGVGGMKTYPFQAGEIAWLAPAIAKADFLFLAESGAPTLTAGMGTTTLIYRDLVAELAGVLPGQDLPPLILDVCVDGKVLSDLNAPGGPHWQRGYRDYGTSPEAYAADLRNYDIATLYDPYVRHVFWFATNITEETKSFDVNTPMLAIADGWYVAPGAE